MKSERYYHRLTDADRAKIVRLYEQHVRRFGTAKRIKRSQIAKRFGVSPCTISYVIRKFNEKDKA